MCIINMMTMLLKSTSSVMSNCASVYRVDGRRRVNCHRPCAQAQYNCLTCAISTCGLGNTSNVGAWYGHNNITENRNRAHGKMIIILCTLFLCSVLLLCHVLQCSRALLSISLSPLLSNIAHTMHTHY